MSTLKMYAARGIRVEAEIQAVADDVETIKRDLLDHLLYSVGKDPLEATARDWFEATAHAVRYRMIQRWMKTQRDYFDLQAKRVYYMSMEFLIGRTLADSLVNLELYEPFRQAISELKLDFDELASWELEAALGNGGLGRLAACFLDSLASLNMPGFGYGIRYEYGMFSQRLENGWQVETPENWLRYGNPWEYPRPGVIYPVKFGGHVTVYNDSEGNQHWQWAGETEVMAMAYDVPVPGYGGETVNNLRLWSAKSTREFNLEFFNRGDYMEAVRDKNNSETLSRVLYPNDSTAVGKELRLKQEYFFVSASIQDILVRYHRKHGCFDDLADHVAIQMNDTHPALTVAELMRVLIDDYGYEWDEAWEITRKTCAYTNHTLMSEALETWQIDVFERVLPRHIQIIYEINFRFLNEVRHKWPGDSDVLRRMSIIDESGGRRVRMAYLAIVGSHKVNGVAQIHTDLLKSTLFSDFENFEPGKIINKTNGITPRRWMANSNHGLTALINKHIGKDWLRDLDQLRKLEPFAEDPDFRKAFAEIKLENKKRLALLVENRLGLTVDPTAMFDVMVKRIHEYKRQLLNVLHVITRYNRIRSNPTVGIQPRVVMIGGKAAPGYATAKLIVKLINDVADVVNHDPLVGDKLKFMFVPNYNVSSAEIIIPGANLSEQISTAGTEASGTGNMKFALNGALTVGTWDGANVEICEEVGEENMFLFGLSASEVAKLRGEYDPWQTINANPELAQAIEMLRSGYFSPDDVDRFKPITDLLTTYGDFYLLTADYAGYIAAQERADALFQNQDEWVRKAILNVARMGKFSSDRTIREYAKDIWGIAPRTVVTDSQSSAPAMAAAAPAKKAAPKKVAAPKEATTSNEVAPKKATTTKVAKKPAATKK